MPTTSTTSVLNTPQAADDYYTYTEAQVLASNDILTLDVMSNDSGGKSKTLYSVEASADFVQALAIQDLAGEAHAQYFNGVKVWIQNNKLMVDVSHSDALAALGAQSIEDLHTGQQLNLSFAYEIQMGNGAKSIATVHLTINGEGSAQVTTIGGDTSGAVIETNSFDSDGTEHGIPVSTHGHLTISGAPGVGLPEQMFADVDAHTDADTDHHYGTFALGPDGNWSYVTTDSMDWLAAGQTKTDTFTVHATDGTTQDVTITITGTDDAPSYAPEAMLGLGGSVTEGDNAPISGHFDFTDPDLIQHYSALSNTYQGQYGTLTSVAIEESGASRSLHWTYVPDADAIEHLGLNDGESTQDNIVIQVDDGSGMAMSIQVAINIHGANEIIEGSGLINGTDNPETILGSDGDDVIYGNGGNDTIFGYGGNDELRGGDGDDVVHPGGGDFNASFGGAGNDTLCATEGGGQSYLFGEDGDDVLYGGLGYNNLDGGSGNDTLHGGTGGGQMNGGSGNDLLEATDVGTLMYGGTGSDTLQGGAGNDTLFGNDGVSQASSEDHDWLQGGAGDDTLVQSGGVVRMNGGAGSDTLIAVQADMTIVFDTQLDAEGVDTLILLVPTLLDGVTQWKIELDASVYHDLAYDSLSGRLSQLGSSEGNPEGACILYQNSGLYYDENGGDSSDARLFAYVFSSEYVDASHFVVTGGSLL